MVCEIQIPTLIKSQHETLAVWIMQELEIECVLGSSGGAGEEAHTRRQVEMWTSDFHQVGS